MRHLQNFVYDTLAGIDADKLPAELLKAGKEKVPDYAFDCHTLKGKRQSGSFFARHSRCWRRSSSEAR